MPNLFVVLGKGIVSLLGITHSPVGILVAFDPVDQLQSVITGLLPGDATARAARVGVGVASGLGSEVPVQDVDDV